MSNIIIIMVERIEDHSEILAIIIYHQFHENGIHFFTPDDFSQQLAYMKRPENYEIEPHVHNIVTRKVHLTQEVLFIRKGKIRVDFYSKTQTYLESRILQDGDVILLSSGGHGFVMLEETEMIEVKQGPYAGDRDKVRIKAVNPSEVKFEEK